MRYALGCLFASAALFLAGCGSSTSHTTPPPTAPTVTSVTPTSSATGVAVNSTVTATFSEAMTASSISSSTFTLTQGGTPVAGAVTYNAATNTATLTPSANLTNNTQYTVTITTGVTASNGAALAATDSWSFTTVAGTPPTVTAVTPVNSATGVSITAPNITATFSENMNTASITSATFTLTGPGNTSIAGTVTPTNATTFAFTPNASLAYNTTYTATITTGAQSTLGSSLAANYTWSFTTALPPAPTITATSPINASTNVSVSSAVTVTFSEPMNAATLNTSTFTLTPQGGSAVAGTVTYNSGTMTATFTPSANLAYSTMYFVALSSSVMATNGAALQGQGWDFTTAEPLPTVTSVTPTNNLTSVAIGSTVTATFSEAMTSSTLTPSTFTLSSSGGPVTGTVSYNSGTMTATFTPSANLAYDTLYTATITTGAQDSGGGGLASNYTWSFTTVGQYTGSVDFGTTFQTIRGFGGASVWLGTMPSAVAKALFDPTNGLGLSILRVRIDPTGNPSGAGSLNGYPYEDYSWDEEAVNGTEAVQNNPNAIVFATPWTPPAAWKLNGSSSVSDHGGTWNESFNGSCTSGTDLCGGYLDPNHYADYAAYLEDFVTFYNSQNTKPLYAISMQNEPEENVSYESCVWTPDQMDAWVAGNASTITSDPYSTKFMMPEADSFQPIQALTTLQDTNAEGLVSIIGGHIYGVTPAPYSIPNGDSPKEIWMTEFGPLSNANVTQAQFAQALNPYGLSIHNSLVNGQYNAYIWWGAFGQSTGSCSTAAGTCGLVDNSGNVTVMGELMGQYSKFVLPGYKRASATASPTAGVYVSAYTGTQNATQHYVIVALNTSTTTAQSVTFTLQNANGLTSMTPWQSTSSAGLVQGTAVPVTASGQVTLSLPVSSITTLEY